MDKSSYDKNPAIEKIFLISEDLKTIKQIHDGTDHAHSLKGEKIILFWKDTSKDVNFYQCVKGPNDHAYQPYSEWDGMTKSEVTNELKTLALLLK